MPFGNDIKNKNTVYSGLHLGDVEKIEQQTRCRFYFSLYIQNVLLLLPQGLYHNVYLCFLFYAKCTFSKNKD